MTDDTNATDAERADLASQFDAIDDLDAAVAVLRRRVYAATQLLEQLEHRGRLRGNGHLSKEAES